MKKIFQRLALSRIFKKIDNDVSKQFKFEITGDSDESNKYFTTDNAYKDEINILDKKIMSYGFQNIGTLKQINPQKKLIRDVYQKLYLSNSKETYCCLGLMQIAYKNTIYLGFVSQLKDDKYILNTIIKCDLKIVSVETTDYKVQRSLASNEIDVAEQYSYHINESNAIGKENGFKLFSGIEEFIKIEIDLHRKNLIRTLRAMRDGKTRLKWYYRIFLDDGTKEKMKIKVNQALKEMENDA